MQVKPEDLKEGSVITITGFDDIEEHQFLVHQVFDDCVSGYSLTGSLIGEYGEPTYDIIKEVVSK